MRKTLRIAPALALILLVTACATTTPAQVDAFNGLKTVRAGVEATLKVFNAGYQAGTYTELQRTQVGNLYAKYLAADKIAATLLGASVHADPGQVIADVTVAAGDLVKFIQSLKGGTP
jgi:hypothetical protein